ncbi:MAG: hypothetical protein WCJ19_00795 [bacterium]
MDKLLRKRYLYALVLAVLLVVLLTIIFRPSNSAKAEVKDPYNITGIKPCELLSQKEAKEILEEETTVGIPGDSTNSIGMVTCKYSVNDANLPARFIQLTIVQDSNITEEQKKTGLTSKSIYDNAKKLATKSKSGIVIMDKDKYEAFYSDKMLVLYKNNVKLNIAISGKNRDDAQKYESKALSLIAPRL